MRSPVDPGEWGDIHSRSYLSWAEMQFNNMGLPDPKWGCRKTCLARHLDMSGGPILALIASRGDVERAHLRQFKWREKPKFVKR